MKVNYCCENCGSVFPRWAGKCSDCGEWNTIIEQAAVSTKKSISTSKNIKKFAELTNTKARTLDNIEMSEHMRFDTGMNEFNRVLGGGFVNGSVVLLSGEPGIGKSTLLLQICQYIGKKNNILYVSGEESASQLKMRAGRIGVDSQNLKVLCETDINKIIPEIDSNSPDAVIIDSIQTMYDSELPSSPGSVVQVKQSALHFIKKAKEDGVSIIIVGHVNKDGAIAGPKVLEHMVDAVLYFEGDKQHAYRIIRAVKNRYGSTNEIGVFEMGHEGLAEVPNPSEALMQDRPENVSGNCAVCVVEGTRPLIAEVQALTTQTVFPSPRRLATGLDYNRINLILAVLEKRIGLRFMANDVYVNVAGGLKLEETASDLAVAVALVSSVKNIPVPQTLIAFGEIGLSGECRTVGSMEARINEAHRLGFTDIALPYRSAAKLKTKYSGVRIHPIRSVFDILKLLDG